MQYQEYEYGTETDTTTWTAPTNSAPIVAAPRNTQMQAVPAPAPVMVNSPSEMLVLGSLLQSVQQAQNQQVYLLRDMDARLSRLEDTNRYPVQTAPNPAASFERMTWWALWGLLMLILGSALAVVILLILLNVQFR